MASGTITGTTNNQYIDSRIVWSSTATTSTNSSKVTATLQYKRNNAGYQTYGTGSFSITIDGTKTSISKYITITEDAWVTAVSATKTISHNSDGTKSIALSATGGISGTTLSSTSCSGTAKLDTIPRASTLTSASAVTLGNKCSVKWTSNAKSFRFKLKFALGSWSYTTGAIHPNTTSAYTYTGYTIPLDVANQIPSAKTGTMTVTLYTYSNSDATTQVGSASSKTFTVTVPSNSSTKPTVAMSLSPVSSLTGEWASNFSGLYIQGKTKVQASFSGSSAKYGASISSYAMTTSGYGTDKTSPYQSGWLSNSGTISVTGTATDSRGYSASKTSNITVISYAKPSLIPYTGEKTIVCKRCDSEGNLKSSGTYLRIKVGRKYSKVVSNGVQKNHCAIWYRYKTEGSTSYSSWVTLIAKDATSDYADVILANIVPSIKTSYIVELYSEDEIGEHVRTEFTIPTDNVTYHLKKGGKGIAFGKYAEKDNCFEIADDWNVTGRVYSLGKGKADIPQSADLNSYKEFGVYNVINNTIAASLGNRPCDKAGVLIVSSSTGDAKQSGSWAYILQRYRTLDGKHEYYRLMYTGDTADEWIYNKWEARSNMFWASLGLASGVSTATVDAGRYQKGCFYRVVNENHVYVSFNCAFTYSGKSIKITGSQIPSPYKPARTINVYCPTNGRALARVYVDSNGDVYVDHVQTISASSETSSYSVTWIDGYIDYWV